MQAKTGRQINKIVPLPLEGADSLRTNGEGVGSEEVTRPIYVHCTADAFNLKHLANALREEFPSADLHSISECVHCRVHQGGLSAPPDDGFGEMFFFDVRLNQSCKPAK